MPQHSVKDLLLLFPLPGMALTNGAFDEETGVGEGEKNESSTNEISHDFEEVKVEESDDEEDYISDNQNGDLPPANIEQFEQPIEPGEIFRENHILTPLNQIEISRKRLRPETPSYNSVSGKSRRRQYDDQSGNSEFSAKDIPEDNLINELFGDNATLVETATTDDPDLLEEKRSKTLVNFSSQNVGQKKKRQARGVTVRHWQRTREVGFDQPSKHPVDPHQELTSLDKELIHLEKELTSVELNKVYGPAQRLKVIGCQQKYNGIGGRRSINKGVFWLVASHRY